MSEHPLDNPVWASLTSRHRTLAQVSGDAARYPAEIAPFVALRHARNDCASDLQSLVQVDDSVLFVGWAPDLSEDWEMHRFSPIAQMTCSRHLRVAEGPELTPLGRDRVADMLELTALVYPHYFRPGTVEMGCYLGIYEGARLVAMAGERMACPGYQEISAICTHPDYLGRGYAQRLLATLNNRVLERGETPFLHFSHANQRAKSLYEHMGYEWRSDVGLAQAKRLR